MLIAAALAGCAAPQPAAPSGTELSCGRQAGFDADYEPGAGADTPEGAVTAMLGSDTLSRYHVEVRGSRARFTVDGSDEIVATARLEEVADRWRVSSLQYCAEHAEAFAR